MVDAKRVTGFLQKQIGYFGIFSLILAAFEQIMDEEFVCPCDPIDNIAVCVLYGTIPSIGCFVLTFCFMDWSPEAEDGRRRDNSTCDKVLYSTLAAAIWLFLFFVDGRYLACALSGWKGVYARNDTLGIEKWCKPTGNETSVFESQQTTLQWISRSQIIGFIIILFVICILGCVNSTRRTTTRRNFTEMEAAEHSKMKLHGRLGERKFSFEVEEVTCL
ncbi:uncharacterized protein LOC113524218 isoform X1 [Pangasianodon hypophthalmus]|uniref:uncharacterized protein LOC113524218 isoform X1 n=1 Tax=Pangasianodon hypophthalmus TaxID=310915 RepID=UPI002307B75E|nr:uncharacterized protein LOC113524218 isoform X1 [Pangasianodon hypophthalmus]